MRLHILSDLHLEFGRVDIPTTEADVIVLAGDIDLGTNGLEWIASIFVGKPVLYVVGNHEFYRYNLPALTESLRRETEGSHINLLETNSVEIAGFTFLGCTLWTDFALNSNPDQAMADAQQLMVDYRLIRFGPTNRILRAGDTLAIHRASVDWLKRESPRHDPGRTIVVTHHGPSSRSEAPAYQHGPLSPAFVSDLDALIARSGIPLWIHGHTHHNVDYQLGATRVVTNQRGYPQERCVGFNPAMVIEL